jgi:hypothetical protein
MKRLVLDATRSPLNAKQWLLKLICKHETWATSKIKPRSAECPTCIAEELQDRINRGLAGQCHMCKKFVGIRVPRAKFHPGDGTYRVTFKHNGADGKQCEGSGEAAVGWGFDD